MLFRSAKQTLEKAGLKVEVEYEEDSTKDNGTVLKQSISSGTTVDEGTVIVITINKLPEIKKGTITINVKEITGYKDTYKETITDKDGKQETVEKKNTPKDVSFKVTVNGEQVTRNNETVKENETAKKVEVSGQGTIQIKVTIDGATTSYTMDLNKVTEMLFFLDCFYFHF